MSYQPGPVERAVAKRLRLTVGEVMTFLDVYAQEFLRFEKEAREVEDTLLSEDDSDDPYCAEHGLRFDAAVGCPECVKAAESPQEPPAKRRRAPRKAAAKSRAATE